MYYELEVFTQGISENTMKILDVKSQGLWGKAKSAIKSIWGDSECNYSIRLGKEIITQASVAENKDGISMSVKGHLYKPDQTYENVALLAEWFQDQEDFNVIDKVRYEQREALEKDRNTIGNEKAIKTHSLSGVIEPGVAAAANAAQAAQSGRRGRRGRRGSLLEVVETSREQMLMRKEPIARSFCGYLMMMGSFSVCICLGKLY